MVGHDAPMWESEQRMFPVDVNRFIRDMKSLSDEYLYETCTVEALVHDLKLAVSLLETAVRHLHNTNKEKK